MATSHEYLLANVIKYSFGSKMMYYKAIKEHKACTLLRFLGQNDTRRLQGRPIDRSKATCLSVILLRVRLSIQ